MGYARHVVEGVVIAEYAVARGIGMLLAIPCRHLRLPGNAVTEPGYDLLLLLKGHG